VNALIDELTPPGIARRERSNIVALLGTPAPVHTVGTQPASGQEERSH
jgi:hypothetical protein